MQLASMMCVLVRELMLDWIVELQSESCNAQVLATELVFLRSNLHGKTKGCQHSSLTDNTPSTFSDLKSIHAEKSSNTHFFYG